MQNLNARTATLEKTIGSSGKRPAGMSDREFLRYLAEMPHAQKTLFKAAMSIEDVRSILKSCLPLLKNTMQPDVYAKFMLARETGNSAESIAILKGYIEGKRHAKP